MSVYTLDKISPAEQTLLQRARAFEEQALGEIYDLYSPDLYRYAMRLLGDASLAEECVAEAFSRFLFALRHGNGPKDYLRAYLYRVAHNWIVDFYRRSPQPSLPLDHEIQASGPELSERVEDAYTRQQLRTALARLTPDQRQVIVLKYLEERSNEEIGRAIGKPVGAVKALQHRALAALRRLLPGFEEEK